MKHFDAFAGIGGWAEGFRNAGITTVAGCEIDDWRRARYGERFPSVRMYGDIATVSAARLRADGIERIDVLSGSFPCQDISSANTRGRGIDGERSGLVWELLRLCEEMRPYFLCAENSPRLRTLGYDRIAGHLEALGYACQAFVVAAGDVGAPHERERVWIIAADTRCVDWRADLHAGGGPRAERQSGVHGTRDAAESKCLRPLQPQGSFADERRWTGDVSGADDFDAAGERRLCGGSAEAPGWPQPEPAGDDRRYGPDPDRAGSEIGQGIAGDLIAQLPPALRIWAGGWPDWNGGVAGLAATYAALRAGELAYGQRMRDAYPRRSARWVANRISNWRNRGISAFGDGIVSVIAEAIGRAMMKVCE